MRGSGAVLWFLPLTVMAGVGHWRVVLEVSVLVLRHGGGEAAVPAPVGVRICGEKRKANQQTLKQTIMSGGGAGGETHWRAQR